MTLRASVIIPTFNRPVLMAQAVASALDGLPDACEVIVVDDGDTAPVGPALDELMAQAPVRLVRTAGRLGAAAARNAGAAVANGAVLLFLDDDDLLAPGYVAAVVRLVEAPRDGQPRLDWGFSPIEAHGPGAPAHLRPVTTLTGTLRASPAGRLQLGGLGCGFWVRRAVFDDVGGINPDLRVNEDTEFCVRLMSCGHWPWVADQPGCSVLRGDGDRAGGEGSLTHRTPARLRAACFRHILDAHAGFLATAPALRDFLERRYVKMLAKTGAFRAGLTAARKAGGAGRPGYFIANWLYYRLRPK